MSTARTSQRGVDLIKHFEGFRSQAYQDAVGVWTIGWGTTRVGRGPVMPDMVVTREQAEEFLRADLFKFEKAVINHVKVPLNQNQFDALVSFTYNVGAGAFGKSTLLKMLNLLEYEKAEAQFGRWVRAGGNILPGLVKRREAERKLFAEKPDCYVV